jgi:glycosyltransferase involved in cell wall biosynthesis
VRVIRNGVDVHKFKRTPSGFRKRHGIAKSDVVFVFVGRFVHKNGPMLITRAASLAARKCPNAKFVFVGEGSQLKECKALAKELSLGKNALFLGYKKDVVDVLSGSDVFVSHVTKSMEGIGINVLEGMACKLAPLVGQDRITEKLFRDGRDALLVKEGNTEDLAFKMILLIKKPGLRRRIAQAAYRKIIDRFSIRNTLRLVEETLVSAYIERSK